LNEITIVDNNRYEITLVTLEKVGLEMNRAMKTKILVFISIVFISVLPGQNDFPKIYSGDAEKIFSLRTAFLNGELKNDHAIKHLIKQADKLLDMVPLSVVEKEIAPPSGNKHDYMSLAPYWWPNPQTENGLPYIRKDGEKNPEELKITDDVYQAKTLRAIKNLSLAYYITNNSKYSAKAARLLRIWFLDEKTRMNPNLNYGQLIRGINEGRGAGIMDVHDYYKIVDAISLLKNSNDWTNADNDKIKKWFDEFLNWLRTSKNGIHESKKNNNHGTWYEVQVIAISLFIGNTEFAKEFFTESIKRRIDIQIKGDGTQPFELVRTKSWHYSAFNLTALNALATLGEHLGIDLWNYTNSEGGSMRKALDYILPAALDEKAWFHQEIGSINLDELKPLLLNAERKFDKDIYSKWIEKLYGNNIDEIENQL